VRRTISKLAPELRAGDKQMLPISAPSILEQLGKILASPLFANADQSRALLKFIVEQAVNHQTDRLKEYTVGAEALGRGPSFDPRTDTIVRAEASRLRSRLERYYAAEGRSDPVEIALPKGSYSPQFIDRGPPAETVASLPANATGSGFSRPPYTWIAIAGLVVAVAATVWALATSLSARSRHTNNPVLQFVIEPPQGTILGPPIGRQSFAISPDGTRLAFTAKGPNGTEVWMRDLAALDLRRISGSEGAWSIFWSPDSRSIFFSVKRTIKQANLDTGSTRSVATLPLTAISGTWRSKDDLLLYLAPRSNDELQVTTGSLRELEAANMRWAQFLPGSDRFVHVEFDPIVGRYRAEVTDYVTHRSISLMEADSRVQFAPSNRPGTPGHLLFIRAGSLLAQPFDPDHSRLTGEPFPLVPNVNYFGPSASACFSVSENGVLVYQAGLPLSELQWYDRAGRVISAVGRQAPFYGTVRIAPDGRRLTAGVWSSDNGGIDVWVFNEDGTDSRRLTQHPSVQTRSIWSPDGARLAFSSTTTTGPPHLASLSLAEPSKELPVTISPTTTRASADQQIQLPTDWSADGRFIAYDVGIGEEEGEVWLTDVNSGKVMPLLQNQFSQWGAVFSPSGKQVAFVSDESGRAEVYVQSFEGLPLPRLVGERHQVSRDGAWMVRWRGDGRELFYLGLDNWLHAIRVTGASKFGEQEALFRIPGVPQFGTGGDFQFDVTRDGRRFIMSTTGSAVPPDFTVIQNWQEKFHH
jgi:Tol biopolymer transport system component